ncbi:hypothetical protein ACU5AX_20360 [Sphingomonas sp. XXL09]|uniref:hypothetical protein n=1 Tax=Sphingomonas sp. XXL09 TaxID=3457787 RepID=UPI00406BB21E
MQKDPWSGSIEIRRVGHIAALFDDDAREAGVLRTRKFAQYFSLYAGITIKADEQVVTNLKVVAALMEDTA